MFGMQHGIKIQIQMKSKKHGIVLASLMEETLKNCKAPNKPFESDVAIKCAASQLERYK